MKKTVTEICNGASLSGNEMESIRNNKKGARAARPRFSTSLRDYGNHLKLIYAEHHMSGRMHNRRVQRSGHVGDVDYIRY